MIPGLVFVHTDCQSGEVHGVCAVVLLSAVHVLLAGGRLVYEGVEEHERPVSEEGLVTAEYNHDEGIFTLSHCAMFCHRGWRDVKRVGHWFGPVMLNHESDHVLSMHFEDQLTWWWNMM